MCLSTKNVCDRTSARLRVTIAALAVERYRQARGRWPGSLSDLVPGQLEAVPPDPHDGQPLRYRATPDGVEVHSLSLAAGYPPDIRCRLWDVSRRRQDPPKE
jgi:hypothetical protein